MCCIAATPARAHACAAATDREGRPAGEAQSTASTPNRPSESDALAAYIAARAWLDADAMPSEDAEGSQVAVGPAAAVCVLLRLDGRLVGSGDASVATAATAAPGAVDRERMLLVRRAVGRAVARALSDSTIASVRGEVGDKVTRRLSLEIELAGPVRPLIGRTVAEASLRIDAGNEGIALLRADRLFRAFPSRMLASDIAARPDRAITALFLEAGLPVKDLNAFAPEDRVSLGRFDTVRLRASSPTAAPTVVTRAGRIVEPFEVTPGLVRAVAAQLAARLAGQVVELDPGSPEKGVALLGTLNPTADAYAPPFAQPRDAAFAALALRRAATSELLPEATRGRAGAGAAPPRRAPHADGSADRDFAADCLLMLACGRDDAERTKRLSARAAAVAEAATEAPIPTTLAAAALLAADSTGNAERAGAMIRALLARHAGSRAELLDAALPLALVATHPSLDAETRSALAALMLEFSALARSIQIDPAKPEHAMLPRDLAGGLLLPDPGGGLPDTQCLPLATALALAEPLFPEEGRAERLASGRAFTRFLIQHVADDPWIGGFRNPGALRGLVRTSLAGDDCPPGQTAAGLLLALSVSENASRFAAIGDGTAP
jgi:hypothetical protein